MELKQAEKKDLLMVRRLYETSFPRVERKPFSRILRNCRKGRMEVLAIWENLSFVGFFVTALCGELVLIDYFAVAEGKRNQGIGGKALCLLQQQYPAKKIFLEIERTDEKATNAAQREKRKNFYLENGMKETGMIWSLFGVPMEILSFSLLSRAEIVQMYAFLYGRFWFLPIRPM